MLELNEANLKKMLVEHFLPKIRNDGGNIELEKLAGDEIHFGAYQECADCPVADGGLRWWLENEIERLFGAKKKVVVHRHIPYYKR